MIYFHLFLLIIFILLFLLHRKNNKKMDATDNYLKHLSDVINAIRYGNLSTKIKNTNKRFENLTNDFNRMTETFKDRESMINEFQEELLQQNKFLQEIINALSDGFIILNKNKEILRYTPKIVEWFDEKENLNGKNVLDYIQLAHESDFNNLNNVEVFVKGNASKNFVLSTMQVNLTEQTLTILLITDITNQKELDTLKEDFVATLTHDLKVPIVAEANILEFLLQNRFGDLTNEQREVILNIQTSNKELNELVQIMLETYKLKESGIVLIKETFDVNEFIKEIRDEMRTIIEKSELKIKYSTQFDFCVTADRMQLKRVVKNLIQNAVSHSGTSEFIDINIYEADHMLNIDIKDYGKGISQEELEKIFNKYYSTAKKFRKIGTGLGLYLSDQIIKAHQGKIIVKSEIDKGSVFTIKIPFK